MTALAEALPTDVNSTKFDGVLVNDGGTNKLLPFQGGSKQTLNGEDCAPMMFTPSGDVQIITTQLPGVVTAIPLAVSGQLSAVPASFLGFYVATSTGGVLSIYNALDDQSGLLFDSIPVAAGQSMFIPWPLPCSVGIYAALTDCTITGFVCP